MRAALLLALIACHPAPAPQQPAPPPGPQGCANVAACNAQADDALHVNDVPRALDGLARACAFGDAHSCAREGVYLTTNPQKEGDTDRAVTLLQKACDDNDPLGCEMLAPSQNDQKAAQLYEKPARSAARRHAARSRSCSRTAPVPPPTSPAPRSSRRRAARTAPRARATAWGESYAEGWLGAPDPARASELFTKACEQGDGRGCLDLAKVTTDPEQARHLREKACASGVHEACAQ